MTFKAFLLRLNQLFKPSTMQREITEELEFHQTLLRERLSRQGVPADKINTVTTRIFGSSSRWQERVTELWQFRTIENVLRDLSFSPACSANLRASPPLRC